MMSPAEYNERLLDHGSDYLPAWQDLLASDALAKVHEDGYFPSGIDEELSELHLTTMIPLPTEVIFEYDFRGFSREVK
jgi:hypothetical protein